MADFQGDSRNVFTFNSVQGGPTEFEIKVFCVLFERSLSIFSRTSLKQHMEYSVLPFPVLNPV